MKPEKDPTYGTIYRFKTQPEIEEALNKISSIIQPFDLKPEILPSEVMSRGVQGDEGTYTRVLVLKGKNPGWDILQEISTKITNTIPINRVLFDESK